MLFADIPVIQPSQKYNKFWAMQWIMILFSFLPIFAKFNLYLFYYVWGRLSLHIVKAYLFSENCLWIFFVNFSFAFQFNANGFVEASYVQENFPFNVIWIANINLTVKNWIIKHNFLFLFDSTMHQSLGPCCIMGQCTSPRLDFVLINMTCFGQVGVLWYDRSVESKLA